MTAGTSTMPRPECPPSGDRALTPQRIQELAFGFAPNRALATAVELRLFTHIAGGKSSVAELEAATGASRRGLTMLLNAMVGLEFLTRAGTGDRARYSLTPEADAFLVEGRPAFRGGFVSWLAGGLAQDWFQLTDCVRTGKPVSAMDDPEIAGNVWGELVDTLFPVAYPAAVRAGQELRRLHPHRPLRLLDVAAGSGVWSIAAAKDDPAVQVVAFDLPDTLPHTRRWAERSGVAGQFEYRVGDIRKDDLGRAEFDAAILGHICHSEGQVHTRELLAKVARALKPGGTLVIADMLPDEDRRGPVFPLLFALSMLVRTREGDTFSFAEYDQWLREAGFRDARLLKIPAPSPLVLATRAG
jgi:ubiquinone/menaquinone biosynthesis C-methylase UbiE